jgi:hypothetical protein
MDDGTRDLDFAPGGSLPESGLLTSQNEGAQTTIAQWEVILQNLRKMLALRDNWDAEGAKAPTRNSILSVIDLLHQLERRNLQAPSRVVVGPGGEVAVEWQLDGNYIELEVSEPYVGEWMFVTKGAMPKSSHLRLPFRNSYPRHLYP